MLSVQSNPTPSAACSGDKARIERGIIVDGGVNILIDTIPCAFREV